MMMRRRRARSAVAIAAGAAVLATVPLFIHHAPAPGDVSRVDGIDESSLSVPSFDRSPPRCAPYAAIYISVSYTHLTLPTKA